MNYSVYDRVVELCKEKEISQRQLQSDLNLSVSAVSRWKISTPRPDTLEKIAKYFNVTTDYLEGKSPYMNQDHMMKCWQEKYSGSDVIPDLMLPDGTIIEFKYSKDEGVTIKKSTNQKLDYVYIDDETRLLAERLKGNTELRNLMLHMEKLSPEQFDIVRNMIMMLGDK